MTTLKLMNHGKAGYTKHRFKWTAASNQSAHHGFCSQTLQSGSGVLSLVYPQTVVDQNVQGQVIKLMDFVWTALEGYTIAVLAIDSTPAVGYC